MAPLIPYIDLTPHLVSIPYIGGAFDPTRLLSIKPFGALVALGVYVGAVVGLRHGRERKLDEKMLSEFIFWVVVVGFVGGHVLDAVFYHPEHVMRNPAYLLMLWEGLSSYGGFIGGTLGVFLWRWRRKLPVLPMVEVYASVMPLAWVFGRTGCATVHDHPGILSDAWYAVRWPVSGGGVVGRLDLGLMEMVLTIPIAVTFLVLWRRKPVRPVGFYTGWMLVSYAPMRFLLDFLRVDQAQAGKLEVDPRYGGLTPAQWACFGALVAGFYFLRIAARGGTSRPAVVGEAGAEDGLPPASGGDRPPPGEGAGAA